MYRLLSFIRTLLVRHPLASLAFPAALAVLAAPELGGADTTFVWKDCSPNCGSGSWANPYETIQAAVNAVGGSGAIIAVRPGTSAYKEAVSIPASKSGTSGSPFTLLARGSVTIDGGETGITGWQLSGDIWSKSGISYNVDQVITNDGLRYPSCSGCNAGSLPVGQSYHDAASSIVYFRCRPGTCNYGGTAADLCSRMPLTVKASYVIVDGFTVVRSSDDGIRVGDAPSTPPPASTGVFITNCTVQYSARDGIDVRNSTGGTLSKNTCAYNSRDGVHLGYANGVGVQTFLIADNVCQSNSDYGSSTYPRGSSQGIQIGESASIDGQHTIERNSAYLNQDTGIEVNHSDNNLLRQNRSWLNKDHGFDHIAASGTRHVSDVAFGNDRDGFSVESDAPSTSIQNCIMADNGRDPVRKDWELEVYVGAQTGFVSNYNVFYRPTRSECHPDNAEDDRLINWGGGPQTQTDCSGCCTTTNQYFATVEAFSGQTGLDAQSKQGNPAFVDPNNGDFRLLSSSTAIDAANVTVSGWVATDVRGFVRHDYAGTANTGNGTPTYADIGPYEFDSPPGAPTIAVCFEQFSLSTSWTERGDDGDIGTAGQYQVIVNGEVKASGTPAAPGNLEEVPVSGLQECTAYTVKVKMTEVDNGQTVESNVVSGSTSCGWPPPPCGTESPGRMRAAQTVESEQDFPLELVRPQPIPSRGLSLVRWSIPRAQAGASFELSLFDVAGRRVSTLAGGAAAPGTFTREVALRSDHGAQLDSGVYFLRLRVGSQVVRRVLVLAR